MDTLWKPKSGEIVTFHPQTIEDAWEGINHPERFFPYERLYGNLTHDELLLLIEDAKKYKWEALDLRRCGIDELPEELGQLSNLRLLALGNTFDLDQSIKKIYLFSMFNTFHKLPDSIGHLGNLRVLNLANTKTDSLPESFRKLSCLQVLSLRRTSISTLPECIEQFCNLQLLDLSGSHISQLPEYLGRLYNLSTLMLVNCNLNAIPNSIVDRGLPFVINDERAINCVNLTYTRIMEGGLSLFSQPRNFILEYYRNQAEQEVNECKVVFLGDGAAGKSSLIRRIVYNEFRDDSLPTGGVEITKWNKYPDGRPLTLKGKRIAIRFLDFGGQEIMHSIHRCFLTSHTVYVVVCDSRTDAIIDTVAVRWIETVKSLAPDCPVILSLNKSDLNHNIAVNERKLKEINPQFRLSIRTSAKDKHDAGVQQLEAHILAEVPDYLTQITNNSEFLRLKQELEREKHDYLDTDDFIHKCLQFKIRREQQADLLEKLQRLGVVHTFSSTFQDIHILNPTWLANGIYRLIFRTPSGGFVSLSSIRDSLLQSLPGDVNPNDTYNPREMEFILKVMRKFEISMCVTETQGREEIEMIPVKMGVEPPARYRLFPKSGALHLNWSASFFPNNVVHYLLIRKYRDLDPDMDISQKCVWRKGGWFRRADGKCEALVEMTDTQNLDVYVQGQDAKEYLDELRMDILGIFRDLNITEPKEYICYSKGAMETKLSYKTVRAEYLHQRDVYCEEFDEYISAAKLLQENYLHIRTENNATATSSSHFHSTVENVTIVDGSHNQFYQNDRRKEKP